MWFLFVCLQSLYIVHGNEYLRTLLISGIITGQAGPSWLVHPWWGMRAGGFCNETRVSVSRSSVKHNCNRLSAGFLGGRGRKNNRLTAGDLPFLVITYYFSYLVCLCLPSWQYLLVPFKGISFLWFSHYAKSYMYQLLAILFLPRISSLFTVQIIFHWLSFPTDISLCRFLNIFPAL